MNINFFSQAGAPFSHLEPVSDVVPQANFVGKWTSVEFQPDLFAPQRFTVGIVAQMPGDRIHYNLLSDFRKFDCIYGARLSKKLIVGLMSQAEEVLRNAAQLRMDMDDIDFGSPNVYLASPLHSSGQSVEIIINRLYQDTVVLEPSLTKRINQFETLDTSTVRQLVNQELKRIAGSDFERIVLDSKGGVIIPDQNRSHYLDINLRTTQACGSVVSAVYKSVQSVEMNLLRANLDLSAFAKLKQVRDKAVFLMLPERQNLETSEWERIENVVGEHSWKLERDGFRVVGLDEPVALAQEIYDWAKPTI